MSPIVRERRKSITKYLDFNKVKIMKRTRFISGMLIFALVFTVTALVPTFNGGKSSGENGVYAYSSQPTAKELKKAIKQYYLETQKLAKKYKAREKYAKTAKKYYKKSLKTNNIAKLKKYGQKVVNAYVKAYNMKAPLSKAKIKKYQNIIFDDVNKLRVKSKLKKLVLDKKLCDAAQIRAKEISKKFSSTRPDGSPYSSLIPPEYGCPAAELMISGSKVKEVVGDLSSLSGLNGYMKNPSFEFIGVGVFKDKKGEMYYILLITPGVTSYDDYWY